MGGYAGAAISKAGFGIIIIGGWTKTLIFIVVAPIMGMVIGFILMVTLMWIFHDRSSTRVNNLFRKLQLISAALYSLGHGTNDAQKTMGVITTLLVTTGVLKTFEIPWWVIISCYFSIALGTLFGGWRIVKTMGQKVTKLKPSGGFCAETAGGITLLVTAFSGIAVSTTHTITGAIMGVGATKRLTAVPMGACREDCHGLDPHDSMCSRCFRAVVRIHSLFKAGHSLARLVSLTLGMHVAGRLKIGLGFHHSSAGTSSSVRFRGIFPILGTPPRLLQSAVLIFSARIDYFVERGEGGYGHGIRNSLVNLDHPPQLACLCHNGKAFAQ